MRVKILFRYIEGTILGLTASALVGCKPEPAPPGQASTTPTQASTTLTQASTSPTQAGPAVTVAPAQPLSPADQLWNELTELSKPIEYPAVWQEHPPDTNALAEWKLQQGKLAMEAAQVAAKFYERFPEDSRSRTARDQEYQQLNQAFALGETNAETRLLELESSRLSNSNETDVVKLQLRTQQLQRRVQLRRQTSVAAALDEMEQGVRQLRADFPGRPEVNNLLLTVARGWLESGNSVRSLAVVRDILGSDPKGDVKELALTLQRQLERLGQPLELRFTALDGREVDLAKLRGKVVLIDFWATWCAPCISAIPELRQLYTDLHPKGLEIIGISFDQDRQKLEQLVRQEELVWPHYFEAEKTGNRIGQQFQINGIPTVWLVDKEGRLRDLNAWEKVRSKVENLLTE